MRIAEAIFRQIIKEEVRRVLSEETAIAGITIAGLEKFATNKLKNTVKSMSVGGVTGLGSVAAPVSAQIGPGGLMTGDITAVVITPAAVGPFVLAATATAGVVWIADSAWGTFKIMNAAADRNTKAAISQAKILLWTAGINSGKNQGIFSSAILASLGSTYKKFATSQPVQQINQYRAMASGEHPNPAVELSQADKANIGAVFSMLTSADIDKAFNDARPARGTGAGYINDQIYNKTITDFKAKISELQTAVADQVASLKVNQYIKQMQANYEKERQAPAGQTAEKAKQDALNADADKAEFARTGKKPESWTAVKR
jgi:hypothetical protein